MEEKTMNKKIIKPFFIILTIVSIIVFIISFYDILYEKGLMIGIFAIYIILLIVSIVVLVLQKTPEEPYYHTLNNIEIKKTQENIHHFKCPECKEIFAIKKTTSNTTKPFTLTCPSCGIIGRISPSADIVIDIIPEKNSDEIVFTCHDCKKQFSVWTKTTDITDTFKVYSCPYCGKIHER
jgi:transcription elongation factor Elf1